MKIALTGPGDFVATRVIESFQLGDGPSLAAVAQHPAQLTRAARFVLDLRVADYLDVDSLARGFTGCSAVLHAARATSGDPKRAVSVLCRAASQAGVKRIVFLSTADVHGLAPRANTTEKSALTAAKSEDATYAAAAAEEQFFAECKQLGLAGYALRPAVVFGPRADLVANLAQALQTERAALVDKGRGICNSLYVDNLVAAIRLALKARHGAGSAFLLTDAETVTWREFYEAAANELNVAKLAIHHTQVVESAEEEPARPHSGSVPAALPPPLSPELVARQRCTWKLPIARAAKELGYVPPVPFAEGMRRSCAWWRFTRGELMGAA